MRKMMALSSLLILILFVPIFSQAEGIKWQSYGEGLKKGTAENKKIFVNFHADW